MFQERCYDRDTNGNFFADNMTNNIDIDVNEYANSNNMNMNMNCSNSPLIEPMQERCVHRTIMHEVPHLCQFMYDNFFEKFNLII